MHEPRVMDGNCPDYFDLDFAFTFPVDGGPITGLVYNYSQGFNLCVEDDGDKVCLSGCMSFGERSELIEGVFEGGDGGAFYISYWSIDTETGDRDREIIEGQIMASGHVVVDTEDGPEATKMFDPF